MAQKPDPYSLEGVKNREKSGFPWVTIFFALGFVAAALAVGALILTPYAEKVRRKVGLSEEKPVPEPPEPKVIVEEKIVEKTVEKTVKVPQEETGRATRSQPPYSQKPL